MILAMKNNKLVSDFINYFFSDLFVKGFLFLSLPLLSKIMSPSEYGKLSLVNSAIMILYVLISLNLQNAVINRYMKSSENFGSFLYSNLIFVFSFQVLVVLVSPFFVDQISIYFGLSGSDIQWVIYISVLLTYLYVYTIYLQASRQSKKCATYNVASKVFEVILIFAFALYLKENQYLSKIYSQLIITGILLFFVSKELYKLIEFKFSITHVLGALAFSIPLIPHVLSNNLLTQADRFIISNELGLASAGIYSFAYNIAMAVIVIILAWNSSWQPKLYELLNDKKYDQVVNITKKSTIIICFITFFAVLFSSEAVVVMAAKEYYPAKELVPLIIIANSLTYVYLIFSNFVFYLKKSVYISAATLIALGVNLFLNMLFIPKYGMIAAAWTTIASYLMLCFCYYIVSKLIFKEMPFGFGVIFQVLGVSLSAYLLLILLNSYCDVYTAFIIKVIVLIVAIYAIYKNRSHFTKGALNG